MIAGRYTLEREVGRGGMGSVWLARDEILGRPVALKRIGMAPGGSTPDFERAEREARLAAMLNHPHVVAVFDLVAEDDQQWLVMEYVDNVTLAGLVKREGPLTPNQAAPLLLQAADALVAAHAAGIVHRDVKPSNILVTPEGQVKLTDFGIARAEADASLTQTGLVTGSPAYLAPEIASGQTARDSSDVWSLGATLFHALAGHPPYEMGENLMGGMYRIVNEEPPRLADAGWLRPLLEATMTKNPADRWSMTQVRDFLASGPDAEVVHPAPSTTSFSEPSHTRVLPRQQPQAPVPTPAPPAGPGPTAVAGSTSGRRQRRSVLLPVVAALAVVVLTGVAFWLGMRDTASETAAPVSDPTTSASSPSSPASPSASPTPSVSAAGPTAAGMTSFIESYLGDVTGDPQSTFQRLTPEFQAQSGGERGYTRFWSSVRSASVNDIQADPESLTVSYSVDYVMQNNRTSRDDVRLELAYEDGTYLVAGES